MSASQWMSVGVLILLVAFIVFAFRQGFKVKPNKGAQGNWKDVQDNWRSFGGPPSDHSSS